MPCKDAIVSKVPTVKPDQTVEQALKELKKSGASFAPVVDKDKILLGVFSVSRVLQDVLPVSVSVGEEGSMRNVHIPAAPGMAKRLQKHQTTLVSDIMDRQPPTVSPETPLEVAIRHVRAKGEPVAVVDAQSGQFKGVVSDESLLETLQKMLK